VRVYATEVAKKLKVSEAETEALQAAALLHDIGKLAVPEHIISKPGRLSPESFEKMKIHPVVGAEILERVRFPYPVVPIVRAITRNGMEADTRSDSKARKFPSAPASFPLWISSMPLPPTASIAVLSLCRKS
jgi:putative nucleotidyltransferase with HDIG domain